MAVGKNLCNFLGHLGADAELRFTNNGTPVASFRIACGERFRNNNGEWEERAEWVNIVLFGKRAQGLAPYLVRGTRIDVTGSLRTRSWTRQDGAKAYTTEIRASEIILLSTPEGRQIRGNDTPAAETQLPVDFAE